MLGIALAALGTAAPKPSTADIVRRSWDQTLVVGHRGAAAYKPENTLPSFEEAIACEAVATECDVHLSQDRQMAVMHDKTLDRTTGVKGAVKDTPMAAMSAAGVPTLQELTKLTKDRIVLVVEIKDGDGIEQMVVDHLKEQRMVDQTICFSFGSERVARVKAANPEQFGVWLVADPSDPAKVFDTLKTIKADAFGVGYKTLTPELARMARERKIPLFVWTVPPGPEVQKLKDLRVNFIITDHPRDVKKQLG
ncbi:MAG: glycerophosphodiester phosphodiesterase [Fimbriimonas sp.]